MEHAMTAGSRRGRWRRRLRGMTIWQVMLGVMLAGIAALTAVDLYQSGQEANNRNESVLLLQRLRVGIERTYSGDPSFGTADTNLVPVLAARGLIPDSALVTTTSGSTTTTTIRHPFGGNVTVVGHVDSEPTHFKVTFVGIETEVCAALADGYVGRTRARSGIVEVDFDGTEVSAPITRSNVPEGLLRRIDLHWTGPLDELVRKLAGEAEYRFETAGAAPARPVMVEIHAARKPLVMVLRDAGLQAGAAAALTVDAERGLVILDWTGGGK